MPVPKLRIVDEHKRQHDLTALQLQARRLALTRKLLKLRAESDEESMRMRLVRWSSEQSEP
jgi:hypothetical protein